MGTVKNIQRLLIGACLSGLWLGWIGFGPSTGQAAGAPLLRIVQTGQNTTSSCSVPGALEGVDVYQSDGTIDWAQVAQTKVFAYAKASEGTAYTDPTFLTNYAGIKQAGMKAGAFLYFHPAQDPTQQANLLVSQLLKAGFSAGDLVPMIDVDITEGKTSQEIAASLQTAVDVVKSSLLVTPGIYSYAAFFATPTAWTAFAGNPLWIASYTAHCPTVPPPWTDWAIWQYSDTGTVPGIKASVDLDRSNGASLPVFTGSRRTFLPLITSNR
jgi:lysozyme